ncbi:MAG: AAA family ATPase [Candidatus Sumerlaeia bacterium]
MYLQFYGFKEAPFNLTPDSKFLFLSHRHQEALAALLFGVQERKGFICLTGEIGCGKTTLCRALLNQLDPDQVRVCVVLNSYLTDLELLKTINEGYGLASDSDSKKTLLDTLNNFLIDEFSQGRNVVLIIDEAQNLKPETLEQIRMISNLETETAKLIQIVMVGQPELRRTLGLPELEQLNQRITVRYHITALEPAEIAEYIRHRIHIAEPQVQVVFSDQASRLVAHYSRGVPRRINVICDRCLLIGYVQGTFNIDDKIVEQAITEIKGQAPGFEPSSPAAEAAAEVAGAGAPRWLATAGKAGIVTVTVAAGLMIGMFMLNLGNDNVTSNKSKKKDRKKDQKIAANAPMPSPKVTQFPTPKPTKTPAPAPTVKPSPTPRPSPTPVPYDNWQYDSKGVLRVRDAKLAEGAAFLTMLEQWGIRVRLEDYRAATPDDISRYDWPATIAQLNFKVLRTDKLNDALRLNLPVLVHLNGADAQSPYGVIVHVGGDYLDLIDPIHGLRSVRRSELEPKVAEASVIYKDDAGMTGLAMGSKGEGVRELQQLLINEGKLSGVADGSFGPVTREALQALQNGAGLQPSGQVDPATAAWISTRLNPQGPILD